MSQHVDAAATPADFAGLLGEWCKQKGGAVVRVSPSGTAGVVHVTGAEGADDAAQLRAQRVRG
eukprot:gene50505-30733_t